MDLSKRAFLNTALGGSLWTTPSHALTGERSVLKAKVKWKFTGESREGARLYASTNDVAYVEGKRGTFYAVSTVDGSTIWRFKANRRNSVELCAVVDDVVYLEQSGKTYAVDRSSGRLQWQFERGALSFVSNDMAYLVDSVITALDRETGEIQWKAEVTGSPSKIAAYEDTLIVGSDAAYLYGLQKSDGAVRFCFESEVGPVNPVTPTTVQADATTCSLRNGTLAIKDESIDKLYGISPQDGTVRWELELDDDRDSFAGEKNIYVIRENEISAFSIADGEKRWRNRFSDVLTWPKVGDSDVYVGSLGTVHAISRTDGVRKWSMSLDTTAILPGNTNGRFLPVYDSAGTLWGVDTDDGTANWTFEVGDSPIWYLHSVDETTYVSDNTGTVYALSPPDPTIPTDIVRTAVSPIGLLSGGLLGGVLAVGAYFRLGNKASRATSFEEFELLELVYESEHVWVWEARDPAGERVVLKHIETGTIDIDLFVDAVETWADLDVPGVLDVRKWGTDPAPWVATDSWDASLAERATDFTTEELAHTMADTAHVVHRAHREGVTHGRIAPEHVLFVDGDVRVSDWRLEAELRDITESDTDRLAMMASELLGNSENNKLSEVLKRAHSTDSAERYDSPLAFADALRWAVRD